MPIENNFLKIYVIIAGIRCSFTPGIRDDFFRFLDPGSLPRPKIQFILIRSVYLLDFTFKNGEKEEN
jgi:hypothetical protein